MRILCVSDTHVGGKYSISSEHSGEIQQYYYRKWCDMVDEVGRVDALFHLGDVCEGVDKKNDGSGAWETDLLAQAEDAKTLLGMVRTDKYYIADGTPYHTNKNMSADGVVAKLLGGTFDIDHIVKCEKVRVHIRHFTPFSEMPNNSGNGLGKDLTWARIHKDKYGEIKLMLRGHVHDIELKGNGECIALAVPCWKGRDEYIRRKSMGVPDNGYVVLHIDGSSFSYDIHKFDLPKYLIMNESKL